MKPESKHLLDKASRTIKAATLLLEEDILESAVGRVYYAMFHTAKALLIEKGHRKFNKHSAVISAYGKTFAKTGELAPKFHGWLIDAFNKRLWDDYEVLTSFTHDEITTMIQQANEFKEAAEKYLR